jgi:hypothetical protein
MVHDVRLQGLGLSIIKTTMTMAVAEGLAWIGWIFLAIGTVTKEPINEILVFVWQRGGFGRPVGVARAA